MTKFLQICVVIGQFIIDFFRRNPGTWTRFVQFISGLWNAGLKSLPAMLVGLSALWSMAVGIINGTFSITASGARWLRGLKKAGFTAAFDPLLAVAWLWGHYAVAASSLSWSYDWLLEYFRREERAADPHMRPSAEQTIVLFGRNLIDETTFNQYMLDEGFTRAEADKLLSLYQNDVTSADIIRDYWRNSINETVAINRLVETGLSTAAATLLLENSEQILTIDQLLTARTKGHIKDDAMFYNMGHQLGYAKPELLLLEKANGDPISTGQALDWWNRVEGAKDIPVANRNAIEAEYSLIDKPETVVDDALDQGTLNKTWYDTIKSLRYNMLGAPDYIRFAVRDVYDTVKRALFTLDEDYPAVVGAKLKMLGYSPEDAKDAWAAHWELPSPTQAFEMLHRGVLPDGISIEDFLKSADYAPVWRQAMKDISYNPITRTDAKRMYKLRAGGGYDASKIPTPSEIDALPAGDPFKQLVRNFLNNGYTITDAIDLATFTKEDINVENSNERHGISSGLKNAIVAMYKGRLISADDVRTYLSQLTYTDETIEQFIIEAEFFRLQDEKADVAAALKNAYVKALRSRNDTVTLLETAGWTGTPLDDLMGTWDLLRTATELQPHQETTRDLTKTELLNAYEDNIITDVEVVDGLVALGYDHDEATTLKSHADLKRRKAENAMQQELVHQRFLGREITYDTASIELDKYNVPVTQKLVLLKKWRVEQEKRVPDFTLSQLEGMVKAKVMDEAAARIFLRDQGYMDSQVAYLINWWTNKRSSTPEGKTQTKLKRTDVEGQYIKSRDTRTVVVEELRDLGYGPSSINVILDQIDENLNRPIGPTIT